jgi:hypothetical protein
MTTDRFKPLKKVKKMQILKPKLLWEVAAVIEIVET